MSTNTDHSSQTRLGRRLTVVAATAACIVALPSAGIAQAQSDGAAGAQYTVPTVPTTTDTTPTDPDTDVADNGDDTTGGDGDGDATDDGSTTTGSGTTGGGSPSTANGANTSGASGNGTAPGRTAPTRVDYAAFGLADSDVRDDVRAALTQGRLRYRYVATTDKKVVDFIGSSLAKQLSTGGARSVGQRAGQELTGGSALGTSIFRTIFGNKFSFSPFTATVLTRGDDVSAQQVAFLRGLATGFGAKPVPTVYVERSDDESSDTDEFENIPGVSVVEDIDTAAGKQELVRLLTAGGAVPGATGGSIDAQTQSAIASVGDDSSSAMPAILLALLVLGGVVFTGGTLVRRRR